MSADAAAHATVITVDGPAEAAVGAEFVLAVVVSCPGGCDLSGVPLEVTALDSVSVTVPPPFPAPHARVVAHGTPSSSPSPLVGEDRDDGSGVLARKSPPGTTPTPDLSRQKGGNTGLAAPRRIPLKAPLQPGEHVWCLSCGAHESGGRHHGASTLRAPVRIRPHETSLAAWAIPSPVVTGRPFAIKVGAKSAAGCDLAGAHIEVCDAAGMVLANGVLGDTPWPGTSALYWTELNLIAPAEAGMFSWSAKFAAADLAIAHQGSSSRFSIAIVDPPEHRLTVKVVEQRTKSPVAEAQVRLGAYRAATGGSGLAELMVPKGTYDLNVWKSGYEAPNPTVTIDADLFVEVVVALVPEEDPDAVWQM